MKYAALVIGVVIAAAAHVFLGWMWSVAGPVVAGFLVGKRASWTGLVTLVVSWGLLVGWNLAVATAESFNMMETMGNLLGGMPGLVIPLATILMAALLGFVSGALGGALRSTMKPRNTVRPQKTS